MSVKIRQEINIIDASNTGGGSPSNGRVQLDTTQYVNPTYYFEVLYNEGTTIPSLGPSLIRSDNTTTDSTLNSSIGTSSSVKRYRASFTPPAGQTEYHVNSSGGAGGGGVRAARIIVIDNPTVLTSTETQIEIGMVKAGLTSTTTTKVVPDTTLTKYWKYTAANWDGTKTFYAEVTYLMASSKSSGTFVLQEDNGSFASWTDNATIVNAGVATTATRVRTTFTPTDGRNYRIAYIVASSKSAATIYNAKIIVDQTSSTSTATYYFDASQAGPTILNSKSVTNTANAFDGNSVTVATQTGGLDATESLTGTGTTAPTTGGAIASITGRMYDSVDGGASSPGSNQTVTAPAGGWTWSKVNGLKISFAGKGAVTTPAANIYDGATLLSTINGINVPTTSAGLARLDITVTYYTSTVTLTEPQYLLLNTNDAGTGLQTYQTLIDKTNEWAGMTITGKHAIDSDNASNSAKLQDIDNANADITSSTVTGANQQISSDIWANLADGHQIDVNVTNSTGVVAASRLILAVAVTSVSVSPVSKNLLILQARNRSSSY